MKIIFFIISFFQLSPVFASIKIVDIQPEPNYRLTKSNSDFDDLTDGNINKYPIWTKASSVGWSFKSPIMIKTKVNTKCVNHSSGVLSILSTRGDNAGVSLPRRIDIYSKVGLTKYTHIKHLRIDNSILSDRRNHWLDMSINNAGEELIIVLHANGQFIMIDEINYKHSSCDTNKLVHGGRHIGIDDILQDSTARLKNSFKQNISIDTDNLLRNNIFIWSAPTWGKLNNDFSSSSQSNITMTVVKSEFESFSLGLLSSYEVPTNVEVFLENTKEAVEVRELVSVVASSGERVWDPLLPVNTEVLLLKPKEKRYLWFTVNTNKLAVGSHILTIKIKKTNGGFEFSKDVTIEVIADKTRLIDTPQVITWSYSHDLPMKLNLSKAIKDQVNHGVNTFVIHPSKIPHPFKTEQWNDDYFNRLKEELEHYKNRGLILLHLGWPSWLGEMDEAELLNKKNLIQKWVALLNDALESYGLKHNEWALYPVDEPFDEKMEFLKIVAPWIKDVDKNINLYANPIQTKSKSIKSSDLNYLTKFIDFWQPNIRLARNDGHSYFSKLQKDWWVFGGPGLPVKAAPPYEYRKLSWDAWHVGSKGIGFWSYSDTAKSSAWDDFDGVRGDWAVVYEDEGGPVSSRRWEAFRDGVEDFKLLLYSGDKNNFKQGVRSTNINELLKKRDKLIENYKSKINNISH